MISLRHTLCVFAAAAVGLTLSGCEGCDRSPIPITLPFGEDIVIGAELPQLPDEEVPFEKVTIPLSGDGCQFASISELINEIEENAPDVLTRFVSIDQLLLEEIRFTASSGDFDFLEEIRVIITTDGPDGEETYELGVVAVDGGLGGSFSLQPDEPLDLWALLNSNIDCLAGEIVISGVVPQDPVTFDVEVDLLLFTEFGL